MASSVDYIQDVQQFVKAGQLKQAIQDVRPLMEDTSNFIIKHTSDGAGVYVVILFCDRG